MTITAKTITVGMVRATLVLLVLLTVAAVIAPRLNAARFGHSVQGQIESLLGRRIEFQAVRYSLLPTPGFALENVVIYEDVRYGLEPFAYVGNLDARLRIDKLLGGRLQLSSLRLAEPLLNVVKRQDGTWNVVELVNRLSAPRSMPLRLFPAVVISGARLDFQFDKRKATLYIADADLSIYPERSGQLYIQFSGSPARSDRSGLGFGHLRGNAKWSVGGANSADHQLEANVTLDPSNLSELTTLFEGYDIGVHGTVSSEARIEGPIKALRIAGQLRLEDVHRWDLISARGEDWRIRYQGAVDLVAHSFSLETMAARPEELTRVGLQVRATDFLAHPAWSILARFKKAPAGNLLPLGKRMGIAMPDGLTVNGSLDGVIGYSNHSGLAGGVAITDAVATLPNLPPFRTASATATISGDCVHFDPANVETSFPGTLRAGGDYCGPSRHVAVALSTEAVPIQPLKDTVAAWFGRPPALEAFQEGALTGEIVYRHDGLDAATWNGQVQIADAVLRLDGISTPVEHFNSRLSFGGSTLDINRFNATMGQSAIGGEYHFNELAKRTERLRIELPSADLTALQGAMEATIRPRGLLARLRFGKRVLPAWVASRNLEGDISIERLQSGEKTMGALRTHLVWQGPVIQFSNLQMKLPSGTIRARGTLNIAGFSPSYRFLATATGIPWKDGLLNIEGRLESSGLGSEAVQNLRADGTFDGRDISLSQEDEFSTVAGAFECFFDQGWPNLKVTGLRAGDGTEEWEGQGSTQSDGKLTIELQHAGRQRHLESTLEPIAGTPAAPLMN